MRVLGIDEAGRGCVLGALVVGAFVVDDVEPERLRDLGADDSKRLSAKKRSKVRIALDAIGTADVRWIAPAAIDGGNLNALEEEAIVDLVVRHRPDHVIMDALGHPRTLPAVQQRLASAVARHGVSPTWLIAPKADRDHAVCAAASIVAKTARDTQLAADIAPFGDLGSGYPSDPKTRAWLTSYAATGAPWPPFVRTRWQTVHDIMAQVAAANEP